MLYLRRKEVSANLVKKLCDGLDMTLGEFFSALVFDELEQEIQWIEIASDRFFVAGKIWFIMNFVPSEVATQVENIAQIV